MFLHPYLPPLALVPPSGNGTSLGDCCASLTTTINSLNGTITCTTTASNQVSSLESCLKGNPGVSDADVACYGEKGAAVPRFRIGWVGSVVLLAWGALLLVGTMLEA